MDEEIIDSGNLSGDPVLDPVSDPASAVDPVQVVSVDELIERLTSAGEDETEEPVKEEPVEEEPEEPSLADQYFASALEDASSEEVVQLLTEIKAELAPHDLMNTNFADYTVTEGLLLLALVYGVISVCVRMLKGGFSWLSW